LGLYEFPDQAPKGVRSPEGIAKARTPDLSKGVVDFYDAAATERDGALRARARDSSLLLKERAIRIS